MSKKDNEIPLDGEFSLDGIIDVKDKSAKEKATKFWLLSYYEDDLSIGENSRLIKKNLTSFPHLINFVFQIEESKEMGHHSHIAIELDNSRSKPANQFNNLFPGAQVQYIKNIKAAREYCSKRYSRHPDCKPVYYGLEDKEEKRLIELSKEIRDIRLMKNTKERKTVEDKEKINKSIRKKPDELKEGEIKDIKNSKERNERAKQRQKDRIKMLKDIIKGDNGAVIEAERRLAIKEKDKKKLLEDKLKSEESIVELAKKKENTCSLSQEEKLLSTSRKVLEKIVEANRQVDKCSNELTEAKQARSRMKKKLKEANNADLSDYRTTDSEESDKEDSIIVDKVKVREDKTIKLLEREVKAHKEVMYKQETTIIELKKKLSVNSLQLDEENILSSKLEDDILKLKEEYEAKIKEQDNIISELKEQAEKQKIIIDGLKEKDNIIVKAKGDDLTQVDENDSIKIKIIRRIKDVGNKEKEKV